MQGINPAAHRWLKSAVWCLSPLFAKGRVRAAGGQTAKVSFWTSLNLIKDPFVILISVAILIILTVLLLVLRKKNRQLIQTNRDLTGLNDLRDTFMAASQDLIFLKDEKLRYMFANQAMLDFWGLPAEQVIGFSDGAIADQELAQVCESIERDVLASHEVITSISMWQGKSYRVTKFPVPIGEDLFGVGAYLTDITEEQKWSSFREKTIRHHQVLLSVLSERFNSIQELLDFALHEILNLTDSKYGYIYLYDEEKKIFTLNSWTRGVMPDCMIQNPALVYDLEKTGIWGEVVRQRRPIVINDFALDNPLKKGYPEGHVPLKRFMSLPIVDGGRIVAVVGLANKPGDYDDTDIDGLTTLMSSVWNAVRRKEHEEALITERNKHYQTLVSIGDAVIVIDDAKKIEFMNEMAVKLTGWTLEQVKGWHYNEVFRLIEERGDKKVDDIVERVFKTNQSAATKTAVVVLGRSGQRTVIEDSVAPIFDHAGDFAGVVVVFRDVEEKRKQQQQIEHLASHDVLTGLNNRFYLERELDRLDRAENLPITILMGDLNSLKLTNDVFGHRAGDQLLQKAAQVLKNVCREDDLVARWGGDEFVLVLLNTGEHAARGLINRVNRDLALEQVHAIRCSISLGQATKTALGQDIRQVLRQAENSMYKTKILEREDVSKNELNHLVESFFDESGRERQHALNVALLARKLGKALGLREAKIQRLTAAANLHDIGKIALKRELLTKTGPLNAEEEEQISQHPIVGYRILSYFDATLDLAEIVLSHHERWDAKGYPKGLSGEEIPYLARILSITESYDQMLFNVNEAKRKTPQDALAELERCAGKQFDPKITATFIRLLKE